MIDQELREAVRPSLSPRLDGVELMPDEPPPSPRAMGLLMYLEDAAGVMDYKPEAPATTVDPGENFIMLCEDEGREAVTAAAATAAATAAGEGDADADTDLEDVESGSEDGEMTTSERVRYPWLASRGASERCASVSSPFVRLHIEIVEFVRLMSPTPEELRLRTEATESIGEVVKSIWNDAEVEIFGSFKTGLYLPSSDVDLVIMDSGCRNEGDGLKALAIALSRRGLARNLQVIAQARVPIVKFTEPRSGVQFDITFDRTNGVAAADFVSKEIARFPALKPLCLVLKIFLQQRELNEVYTGGIGSYGLLIMIIAHIQTSALYNANAEGATDAEAGSDGPETNMNDNLGQLLYNFFDLYGRKLNLSEIGVSCGENGHFFSKRSRKWYNEKRPNLISLEDPQDTENDVGKNSFNFSQLRIAFEYAHQLLTAALLQSNGDRSILGSILRPDKMLRRRSQIVFGGEGSKRKDGLALVHKEATISDPTQTKRKRSRQEGSDVDGGARDGQDIAAKQKKQRGDPKKEAGAGVGPRGKDAAGGKRENNKKSKQQSSRTEKWKKEKLQMKKKIM